MKGLALILTVAAFCYEPAPQKSQTTIDNCCDHCYHMSVDDTDCPVVDTQETLEEEDDEPARQR